MALTLPAPHKHFRQLETQGILGLRGEGASGLALSYLPRPLQGAAGPTWRPSRGRASSSTVPAVLSGVTQTDTQATPSLQSGALVQPTLAAPPPPRPWAEPHWSQAG